jgi:hypothetical protein
METDPSREATSRPAAQELPSVLCNPEVYYRILKSRLQKIIHIQSPM